jgi:hypothetical protein
MSKEKPVVELTIKRCEGNIVRFERNNEGLREKMDKPYRKKWANAKFTLPSGKGKCIRFDNSMDDESILAKVRYTHQNFSFTLNPISK